MEVILVGNNCKVLVVDDSTFIYKTIQKHLMDNCFESIDQATNSSQGIEKFKDFTYDIVLIDIEIGELDGINTALIMMAMNPEVTIIMLSSIGDERLIRIARNCGIDHFIKKPFAAEDLSQLLNMVWDNKCNVS